MTRTSAPEAPAGSPNNPIPLPKDKKLLKKYYSGERLPSPMGGQLDVLGVRENDDGIGRVLLECNTSSLRYVLLVPKATRTERSRVKSAVDNGEETHCPRHGPYQPLNKSGKNLICPLCGVAFARVG